MNRFSLFSGKYDLDRPAFFFADYGVKLDHVPDERVTDQMVPGRPGGFRKGWADRADQPLVHKRTGIGQRIEMINHKE